MASQAQVGQEQAIEKVEVTPIEAQDLPPLTDAEKAEAAAEWDEKIAYFCARIRDVTKNIIRLHWEEGAFLLQSGMDKRKYGDNVINRYVDSMKERGCPVSASTVYKCLDVAKKYDEKSINRAIERNLTWHQLTTVVLPGVSEEARDQIEKKVAAKEYKDEDEMKEQARKINDDAKKQERAKGKKVSNKGGTNTKIVIRSTISVCTDVSKKLDEFKEALKTAAKMEDGKSKSELLINIRDAFRCMEGVRKRFDQLTELREDLMG